MAVQGVFRLLQVAPQSSKATGDTREGYTYAWEKGSDWQVTREWEEASANGRGSDRPTR